MRRRERRSNTLIYVILVLILILGIFSTIFALMNATTSKIIGNVTINNIEVSGLSKDEAEDKFQKLINSMMEEQIILKHDEYEKIVTLKQMELEVDINDKVYKACTIGRESNIIANNYKILKVMLSGENINLDFNFNNEILESIYGNLDDEWEDKFIDNSYYIDGDKLNIVKGKSGVIIDKSELQKQINELIQKKIEGNKINELDIPTITRSPEEIDLEKIKNEIYKEPKNASYDEETSTLQTHVNGVDFNISIDEANKLLKEEKEEYEVPLKITKPEVTTDKLGEEAFPDELASFATRYDASNTNRATNIELAAKAMNGKVLVPGEVFSFNGTVGPRTKAKGYMLAGAYSAGELVDSYGGGVCQVSSTIYNTALYANLEIVERSNHSSVVSYVNPGRDATVSYGVKDFKFKNSREYAIQIKAEAKNGTLTIKIFGIKEKEEYEIEIKSEVTDVMIRNTKYIHDSKLAPGQEEVTTIGADGAKSIAYKIVKKNGKVISKTVLSNDSYNPMVKIVRTGNKV